MLANLKTVTQGAQTRTFTYDSLSRLKTTVNPESGTVSYVYDDNGNLLVKTDAHGASTHFSYDVLNRATRRWYNGSSSTSATTHNSPVLPSGVAATDEVLFYYDAQTLPAGAPNFVRGYNYGTTLNNSNVQSVSYAGGGLSYTQTFGYDQLNRLTTSQEGASWSQTNSYDRYGNRTIVGSGMTFDPNNNRITNAGYTYDPLAGNLLTDSVHAYTYDAENKISKVDTVSAYVYDGEGQRVRKLVNENLRFIYGIRLK